jgi:hypothetical protein
MSERLHKCTQVEYCSKLIEIESISQDDRLEFYDELSPHILYHPQQKVSYPIRVADPYVATYQDISNLNEFFKLQLVRIWWRLGYYGFLMN